MQQPIAIHQVLPTYARYDAIGTYVGLVQELLKAKGFASEVFTETLHPTTTEVSSLYQQYRPSREQILIFHHSVGTGLLSFLAGLPDQILHIYHNVTPAEYFAWLGDQQAVDDCSLGRLQVPLVQGLARWSWADSQFNKDELQSRAGTEVQVMPVLRDYTALKAHPQIPSMRINPEGPLLLFVGRLVTNKAQHDLFFLLKAYKQHFNNKARLLLVGSPHPIYRERLRYLARKLSLSIAFSHSIGPSSADITIYSHLADQQLAMMYRAADVFVCLSDHEGFCVPLVEAMSFGLPVLAHGSSAIPETLGSGGIIVDKNNPEELLGSLNELLTHPGRQQELKSAAISQSTRYSWGALRQRFYGLLDRVLRDFHQSHQPTSEARRESRSLSL